jgi:hypothetical protein
MQRQVVGATTLTILCMNDKLKPRPVNLNTDSRDHAIRTSQLQTTFRPEADVEILGEIRFETILE